MFAMKVENHLGESNQTRKKERKDKWKNALERRERRKEKNSGRKNIRGRMDVKKEKECKKEGRMEGSKWRKEKLRKEISEEEKGM